VTKNRIKIERELYLKLVCSLQYTVELLKGSCDSDSECDHCKCLGLAEETLSEIERVKH
jgi:hypothetical protein